MTDKAFRELVENANDAIAMIALDGTITTVNRGAERLLGWSRREMIGQHIRKVATSASVALAEERMRRFLAGEKPPSSIFEAELIRKDGNLVPVEARTRVIRSRRGTVVGFQGIYRDLTARKLAERALQRREEYFRSLIENTSDVVALLKQDGTVRYASPASTRVLGYTPEEMIGRSLWELVHVEDSASALQAFNVVIQNSDIPHSFEFRCQHHDTSWRVLEATGRSLLDNAVVNGVVMNIRDITDRKQLEKALRRNENPLAPIFNGVSDLLFLLAVEEGSQLRYLAVNSSFLKATGFVEAQVVGTLVAEIFPSAGTSLIIQHARKVLNTHIPVTYEELVVLPAGRLLLETTLTPVVDGQGRCTLLLGAARDITARRRAEEQIRQAKQEWESTIDALSDLVLLTDTTGTIRRCNRAVRVAFTLPYRELIGRPLGDVLYEPAESVARVFRNLASEPSHQNLSREEIHLGRLGGWFMVTRHPVRLPESESLHGLVFILTDITERKRLEEMLRERVIQPHDIPGNLRAFRKKLNLSQKAFGQAFGGYSQRQINSYETGETEVPIGLLLAIKNCGYSLDLVLGSSKTEAINHAVSDLSSHQKTYETVKQLLAAVLRVLEQEQKTIATVLQQLGIPQAGRTTKEAKILRDMLLQAGIVTEAEK